MKKSLLSILGLWVLGGTSGFSQSSDFVQERILKRIDNEKKMIREYFTEYERFSSLSQNNGEYNMVYYDFNFNNKTDLIACFTKDNSNAEIVMVDKDENNNYEITYIDNNKDGEFDEKIDDIINTNFGYLIEEEIDNIKQEYLELEEIEDRKRFQEEYKKFCEKYNLFKE